MRRLAALVAIFTIIGGNAWAFDRSHEVVGQMYFSIPFGAATKQQATPRLGFRVGFGEAAAFADRSARAPYGVLEWQASLNGQTTLLINGIDEPLAKLLRRVDFSDFGGGFRGARKHFPVCWIRDKTTTGKDCGRCLCARHYQVTGGPFKASFSPGWKKNSGR